jgi:hypothetical protein
MAQKIATLTALKGAKTQLQSAAEANLILQRLVAQQVERARQSGPRFRKTFLRR